MTKEIKSGMIIFETEDYSVFKTLQGNRDVSPHRVAKIKKSIQERGYLPVPILVNEKYEIIDGQGRFAVCKELGLPIYFIKHHGLTIEDCVAMNVNSTNWSTDDYIHSYAERGNQYYIALEGYMLRYPMLPIDVILSVLRRNSSKGAARKIVNSGKLRFNMTSHREFVAEFEFLKEIKRRCSRVNDLFAFWFCSRIKSAEKERLISVAEKYSKDIAVGSKCGDICEIIEEKYNYRLGEGRRIYFSTEYKKYRFTHSANI